jgi:hypothetical protein
MRYEAVPLQMCKNMLLSLTTSLNKVLSVFQGSFTQTAKKKTADHDNTSNKSLDNKMRIKRKTK